MNLSLLLFISANCFVGRAALPSAGQRYNDSTTVHAAFAQRTLSPSRRKGGGGGAIDKATIEKEITEAGEKEAEEGFAGALRTLEKTMGQMAGMLGALASGTNPGASFFKSAYSSIFGDIAKAADVEDPIVGIAISFVSALFGGMFGGTSADQQLYNAIMKQVPKMIQTALLKARMQQNRVLIDGMLDATVFWANVAGSTDKDTMKQATTEFLTNIETFKEDFFHPDCWQGQYTTDGCVKWEQAGSLPFEVSYANTHLATLMQFARIIWNDKQERKNTLSQIATKHSDYLARLEHSRDTFKKYRRRDARADRRRAGCTGKMLCEHCRQTAPGGRARTTGSGTQG